MIKVALVDDHKVLIQGMEALLSSVDLVDVQWTANSGEECLSKLKFQPVEIILMDVSMGDGMNGFDTVKEIRNQGIDVKVILLTMHNEYGYIQKGVDAGAFGYLLKDADKDQIVEAINTVHSGSTFFGAEVSRTLIQGLRPKDMENIPIEVKLTEREREILELIAQELTTAEMADRLHLSSHTIESHRKKLLQKCQVKNTVGLVKYALKAGLVS